MTDIVERLRVPCFENGLDEGWIDKERREAAAEIARLRAALESVMIGGNSLAIVIGADHPPHGTPHSEALAHYGSGVKYEAWCCWNAIMLARAALGGEG